MENLWKWAAWNARATAEEVAEKLCKWAAWRLPRRLAYWAAVRVAAHATTGEHGDTVVPELTAVEALRRWEAP